MLRFNQLDIKAKIMLIVMSISLITISVIATLFFWNNYNEAHTNLRKRIHIEAEILSQNIAASVLFQDNESAEEILAGFSNDKSVISIQVLDKSGETFAGYQAEATSSQDHNVFQVVRNIEFDNEVAGTLIIYSSEKEVDEQLMNIAMSTAMIAVIALLISFFLSLAFQRALSAPIIKLQQLSEQVAGTKNYSLRAEVSGADEIGKLSKMFNHMLEEVENRDAHLEKQVSQRTAELEKLAEEFRYRAFHDSLTGLPNRALLNERFELAIDHAERNVNNFACLLLDLDDFKTINDTKGHQYGDALLIEVATKLKKVVRKEDLVCRLGGDEFIILIIDIEDRTDVEMITKKILIDVGEDMCIKGETVTTAVSIGGAIFPEHGTDLITLKRNADVAMYQAKDRGKNQFCLFSPNMQEEVRRRLMIQNDLKKALENDELILYFQPKILASQHKVAGCEVLVRWQHPKYGFMQPNSFIPYAEETQLIYDLDYYMIEKSCRTLSRWAEQTESPASIAINLSGRHFHDYRIVEVLSDAIKEYEIDPRRLQIEITEAVLIHDPEKAQRALQEINKMGIYISLDDFGTGYSSLSYLRILPIDCIKIDLSFVRHIHENQQDRRITRGIILLGKGLNLDIVAEGVENKEQLNTLLDLGCECMQGYYFSKPLVEADFVNWLHNFALKKVS